MDHYSVAVTANFFRSFVASLQRLSLEAGMPVATQPAFCKYATGVEQVEPMFKHILSTLPYVQLVLVVLPGKSPVYGGRCKCVEEINGLQPK